MYRYSNNIIFDCLKQERKQNEQESRSDRPSFQSCVLCKLYFSRVGTVHCNGVSFDCPRYRDRAGWSVGQPFGENVNVNGKFPAGIRKLNSRYIPRAAQ